MKPIRKLVTRLLIPALVLGTILPTFVGPVQAATDAQSPGGYGSNPDLKNRLQSIQSVKGAQNVFFGKDGSPHDVGKLNVHSHEPDGTKFSAADDSTIGHKYDGNPWLALDGDHTLHEINSTTGDTTKDDQKIASPGARVRFVLTDVEHQQVDVGVADRIINQQCLGNIYIFRNEYNPALAVAFYAITSSVGSCSAIASSDQRHFVYHASCTGTFEKGGGYLSDVDGPTVSDSNLANGHQPTDSGDKGDVEKSLDKTKNVNICVNDLGTFGKAIRSMMNLVAGALTDLLKQVGAWISGVVNIGNLSNNPGLTSAWKTIRDFANIAFILVLVAVAFSNILRVDTERYGIRALLPRVIFAVIAVNFSFLMVQILVNFAFIIGSPFMHQAIDLITNPPADGSVINTDGNFGQFIIGCLVIFLVIIALFVLLLFFVVRIVMVWLLAALSPFVFLFMTLPVTRSLSSSWWKNAFKWIFMAPISFVILFIAAEIISGGGDLKAAEASGQVTDANYFLKIGFFAGAAFAAVLIPLKLGGEIMGHALSAARGSGKGLGKFGIGAGIAAAGGSKNPFKFGRQGGAFLEQRKNNQQQEAQLAAAGAAGGIAQRLSGTRAGRSVAGTLTGGNAATVSAQRAAVIDKFANDISKNGRIGIADQRDIAAGNTAGLESRGLHEAAALARTSEGRQAAGRLLAQKGLLTQGFLDEMPAARAAEQFAAGNNKFMQDVDPMLAGLGPQQELSDTSEGIVTSAMASADPTHAKHFKYEHMHDSLVNGEGGRQQAAQAQLHGVQGAQAHALLDRSTSRTFISEDNEREAFVQSLEHGLAHGSFGGAGTARHQEIATAVHNYRTGGTSEGPRGGGGGGTDREDHSGGGGGRPTPPPRPSRPSTSGGGGRGEALDAAAPEDIDQS